MHNSIVTRASARDRVPVGKPRLCRALERPSNWTLCKPLTKPIQPFSPRMAQALGI